MSHAKQSISLAMVITTAKDMWWWSFKKHVGNSDEGEVETIWRYDNGSVSRIQAILSKV